MRITKTPTAVTPRYSDSGAAGMDLYVDTAYEYELQPGQIYHLPTGIRVEIPRNCFGAIYPRSSLHKKGLTLADTVGIIDSSYRGEIILAVKNIFSDVVRINGQWGLRTPLAQLIIQPYRYERLEVVEEGMLSVTPRGSGGFGSSDVKPSNLVHERYEFANPALFRTQEDGERPIFLDKSLNLPEDGESDE